MKKSVRIFLEATALKPVYKLLKKSKVVLQKQVAKQLQRLSVSSEKLGPPKGVTTVSELRNRGEAYSEIFPKQESRLPVQHFVPICDSLQKTETSQIIKGHHSSSYLLILNQARIYGPNGLIITHDDRIVHEFAGSFVERAASHEIFHSWKLPPMTQIKGRVAAIGYNYAHGYYHWMLEILPRIEILRRSGVAYDYVYMNPALLPFQAQTLKATGFDPTQVLWADSKTHLKVDQAIIPSLPGRPGEILPWVCEYLKASILVEEPSGPKERLLISRRKAARRRILNEEILKSMLTSFGFREVILEDYTVAEQARLFSRAEFIIAAHGAALTNLVFCSPGTVVIELFSPIRTYPNYQVLSQIMNLKYHGLLTSTKGLARTAIRKQDMVVDCSAFLKYLQGLL